MLHIGHEGQPGGVDEVRRDNVFQREDPAELYAEENIEREEGEVHTEARIPGPFDVRRIEVADGQVVAAMNRVIGRDVAEAELVHRPADQHENTGTEQKFAAEPVLFGAAGAEDFLLLQMPGLHVVHGVAALPAAIGHQDRAMRGEARSRRPPRAGCQSGR